MFDKALPQMIVCGMSPEEFWYGDTDLAKAYIEAYRVKRSNADADNWMLGNYIRHAVASCLSEEAKYPEEPMIAASEREAMEVEAKARERRKKAGIAFMEAFSANKNAYIETNGPKAKEHR